MYLQKLSLIDFKNIAEARIELSPRMNCLVGDNGAGKTNLLDAVHYLSMGKSAFNLTDSQCMRHGGDSFLIEGSYLDGAGHTERIVCSCKKGAGKKLCRNGKDYEKLSDHVGLIPLVLITPSDTALINESGEERRRYMNSFISQLDRAYLSSLVRYNRLLAERNRLLKLQQVSNFAEILQAIDMQMVFLGEEIYGRRKKNDFGLGSTCSLLLQAVVRRPGAGRTVVPFGAERASVRGDSSILIGSRSGESIYHKRRSSG